MKKEVYVCNSGSYSMAIKLSKSQAAAIKWFIDKFLDKIDPYENNCISFSDIINVFMEEYLPYDNMSLLDKILSS
jgi:hypothetical protein